jgi:hypothetical protein
MVLEWIKSIFNYTVEEINELTHINSDLAIVCYERNQPIGFIISKNKYWLY